VAALELAGLPMRATTDQRIGRYLPGAGQARLRGVSLYRNDQLATRRGYVAAFEFDTPETASRLVQVLAAQNRGEAFTFYVAGSLVVGYAKTRDGDDNAPATEAVVRRLAASR
jgi:hypothetical protein